MQRRKGKPDSEKISRILGDAQRDRDTRAQGYRERALAIFPNVCARCGREFEGKRLRELTVHHKDHNHMNNPADGSNWELLCLYCHDDEHQDAVQRDQRDGTRQDASSGPSLSSNPFEGLGDMFKSDGEEADSD